MSKTKETRGFSSKFGFLMAAVGSAIGLGNLWSFPYKVGEGGGAVFVLVYLVMVLLIGAVALIGEFYIGKRAQTHVIASFTKITKKSKWVGYISVIAPFLILTYYPIIGGWSLKYAVDYIGGIGVASAANSSHVTDLFNSFVTSSGMPILYLGLFMVIVAVIVLAGVKKGIERASKILMPLLFICLIVIVIKSLTLPGRTEGLLYLFKPDFSKMNGSVILSAMGQVFFSMSLGMGINVAYGSYMKKNMSINKSVSVVAVMDTFMALLAGMAIFPAVFSFGIAPSAGPGLLFQSLASVFSNMTGGRVFGAIFFCLVILAAVTSSIALLEVPVQLICDKTKLSRRAASLLVAGVAFGVGTLISLSFGNSSLQIGGTNLLDLVDTITQKLLLPIVSCATCLYIGWKLKPQSIMTDLEVTSKSEKIFYKIWGVLIKYITPLAIAAILIVGFSEILTSKDLSVAAQWTAIITALLIVVAAVAFNIAYMRFYDKPLKQLVVSDADIYRESPDENTIDNGLTTDIATERSEDIENADSNNNNDN